MTAAEHPWLAGLVGDAEVAALLGAEAEVAAMLRFEAALAAAEARHGVIPGEAAAAIAEALAGFRPDLGALARGTARDGVVVPELVRQIRAAVGEPARGAGAFRGDQPGRDRHGAGAAAEGGPAGSRRRGLRRSSRRSTGSSGGSASGR